MNMNILTFRPIDILLIVLFTLYAASIIAGLIILNVEHIRRRVCRKIILWADKLEAWTAAMKDDEPFDPGWMSYREWKETRP